MLPILNSFVLSILLVLLVMEEVRYRRFQQRVAETRRGLLSLSHQLRSPLAALKKYHLFLRSSEFGKLSLSQQEALSKIDASFGETVVLIERLLARSRIEECSMSSDTSVVDVREGCEAAIGAIAPEAEQREQRIVFRAPHKALYAKADPLLFHGILDELLVNAINYTRNRGTVQVSIESGTSSVTVHIRDNGIGIAPNEKRSIFQKYFRGEKARSMAKGNGLGLAFAQSFAKRMGGSIRFVSTEGKGSTFSLALRRKAS